jgi:hypothetical protein
MADDPETELQPSLNFSSSNLIDWFLVAGNRVLLSRPTIIQGNPEKMGIARGSIEFEQIFTSGVVKAVLVLAKAE